MDWLSKAFEGTSDEISGRQYGWRYGQNTSWVSQPESEELDRAIAKISSASEGMGKLKINDASHLKNNELFARVLNSQNTNESRNWLADYSSHLKKNELLPRVLNSRNINESLNGNIYQHLPVPYSLVLRICGGCNLVIGHEVVLSRMGAVWHPECFRCRKCNLPIADNEFSLSGKDAYHKSCYKENDHPRCDVCQNYIRINADGFIEYNVHPFWGESYCMFHDRDGTPRCCSCERIEKKGTRFVALNDGRKLCLECVDSSIMDTTECQPLYLDIQQYYESLNMKIEQKIPLRLVERQTLNKARNGEHNGHHHMPETRGLCLSKQQTISSLLRQPRIGMGNLFQSEVTSILILYGLPRLLTGLILAHEMMHAWLRLNGYRILLPSVEEGLCQVPGHMWLTSRIACISRHEKLSPFEKKLAELFKHQIESDTSPYYGKGFRAGNRAVLKYGLQKTLHHIQSSGNFPY